MDRIRTRARELRNNPTDAERLLWTHLLLCQISGYKFRRQQPIGNYIVDFACLEKRLLVELDRGQHAEQTDYDAKRNEWLREAGFRVVRFWNHEVLKNILGVKEVIFETLENSPTLILPRKWGGKVIQRQA